MYYKRKMDYLLFWDDDEYPLASIKESREVEWIKQANIAEHIKHIENAEVTMNLMNLHLVFEDDVKKILAEVDDLDGKDLKARFLGEIVGDRLIGGTIRKPTLDAKIRVIDKSEILFSSNIVRYDKKTIEYIVFHEFCFTFATSKEK